MADTLKCPDEDCGHEFTRGEATLDFENYLTEPEHIEGMEAEFHLDVQVWFCCPECGEPVGDQESGETIFQVEVG